MGKAVFTCGSAREVGALLGQWQGAYLRERWARAAHRAAETGRLQELRARAAGFAALLGRVAPHWLEEAAAQAAGCGLEMLDVLALNCLPPAFWGERGEAYVPAPLGVREVTGEVIDVYDAQGVEAGEGGGDCTTFFALGDATLNGDPLLHKNRDERDEAQWCGIKGLDGKARWAGSGDIGNLGAGFVQTEHGWAGANNTGSDIVPEEYVDGALSDAHALRYFAENCDSLENILETVNYLTASGALGGGNFEAGSIWVFVDATRGLVVEATSRRWAHRWFDGNIEDQTTVVRTNHFLLEELLPYARPPHPGSLHRYRRAQELWQLQNGVASIAGAVEIGRDREGAPLAIARNVEDGLNSVTVSAATATVSGYDPRRCQTHVRNGHPAFCPAVILCPVDRVCDSDLLSGAHNAAWRALRGL